MSDSYREQRPLLNDDYSDEDFHVKSYNYKRRNQPLVRSGRARNYARGAAAVLTRWPDNCSTSLAYWWLGVSMIAIVIFVIYNSVLIFGMIPTPDFKQPKYRTFNSDVTTKIETLSLPDVFMHLIINNNTNIRVNKYLPHVRALSNKYPNFKYKFLMVINDTLNAVHDYNDEQRNAIAFNSLNMNKKFKISPKHNISVEYVSLTNYLNNSPIKKFWRNLPPQFIDFLLRAVSIWERGGISFNPVILISKPNSSNYVRKLYELFKEYTTRNVHPDEQQVTTKIYSNLNTKRPNNIQDIINTLDKKDKNEVDLSEAENNEVSTVAKTNILQPYFNTNPRTEIINNFSNIKENQTVRESPKENSNSINNTDQSVLPLFLKYLFHNKPNNQIDPTNLKISDSAKVQTYNFNSLNKSLTIDQFINISTERDDLTDTSTKKINTRSPKERLINSKIYNYNKISKLSLDLKGNIIASKIACHAFLGTMFSNVFQHSEEETLADFIISELSLFCNGLLTSCSGVNVILM